MPKAINDQNPYEEHKQPEQDNDVGNYDPDLIEVPKMAR